MEKLFKDVAVGEQFTLNGILYVRITEKRISCCKRLNAKAVNNPKQQIMVKPLDTVSV